MSRRRRGGRNISGWLILDKPRGATSTDMVNLVKATTRARKVGHGGTLDPLATGVLPIALGEATKTVPYIMEAPKHYRFTLRFGEARDTDDAEGRVIATSDLRPSDEDIRAALAAFTGTIQQRPPAFAAVKVEGRRAYELARAGEPPTLAPRPVRIDRFVLLERPDPDHARFEVVCGKGAYVRALARDLGERLGCLAHVAELRRLAVGPFTLAQAISPDALRQLVEEDTLPQALLPVAAALAGIPAFVATEPQAVRLRSGRSIRVSPALLPEDAKDGDTLRVLRGGQLVALARLEDAVLSPVRVFHGP